MHVTVDSYWFDTVYTCEYMFLSVNLIFFKKNYSVLWNKLLTILSLILFKTYMQKLCAQTYSSVHVNCKYLV